MTSQVPRLVLPDHAQVRWEPQDAPPSTGVASLVVMNYPGHTS